MYDSDTLIGFLVVMSASPCLGSAGNISDILVACPHPHRLEWLPVVWRGEWLPTAKWVGSVHSERALGVPTVVPGA